MFTVTQLFAHFLGDYMFQSGWMANNKTKSSLPALCHVVVYSLVFALILKPSIAALIVIGGTHFLIDRYRLARYVCYAKEWLCPFWVKGVVEPAEWVDEPYVGTITYGGVQLPSTAMFIMRRQIKEGVVGRINVKPWSKSSRTGLPDGVPSHISDWLLIIVDNICHVGINALALYLL